MVSSLIIYKNFLLLIQNRKWQFEAKIPYNLVAATGGTDSQNLTFPYWYSILKIVRTHFGREAAEKTPPKIPD
jgi:hypothetical protein